MPALTMTVRIPVILKRRSPALTLLSGPDDRIYRSSVSPSSGISGVRPAIRSATMRAEPQAIVQPIDAWPALSQRLGCRARPRYGRPVGVTGLRPAQKVG